MHATPPEPAHSTSPALRGVRVLDFDAMRDEVLGDRLHLRVGGVDVPVPARMPWDFMLEGDRLNRERGGTADLGAEDVARLLRMAVGRPAYDALVDAGMTHSEMERVLAAVVDVWMADGSGVEGPDTTLPPVPTPPIPPGSEGTGDSDGSSPSGP